MAAAESLSKADKAKVARHRSASASIAVVDGLEWRVGKNGLPLESPPGGGDYVVWRDDEDSNSFHAHAPTPALRHEPMYDNKMVRVGAEYADRRNQHLDYPFGDDPTLIWCESTVEEASLRELDFQGGVRSVACQPLRILFGPDSPATYRHDVDFFALMESGERWLINVKHEDALEDPRVETQFAEVDRICDLIGWHHIVMTGAPRQRNDNLEFLRVHRRPDTHPDPQTLNAVLRAARHGTTVLQVRKAIQPRFGALAMPFIHHLLWHRLLDTDLNVALSLDSVVVATVDWREEPTCCPQ